MPYPKWKYHESLAPKLVLSAEEEKALGVGWEETPAAFEATIEAKEPEHHEPEAQQEKKPRGRRKKEEA